MDSQSLKRETKRLSMLSKCPEIMTPGSPQQEFGYGRFWPSLVIIYDLLKRDALHSGNLIHLH